MKKIEFPKIFVASMTIFFMICVQQNYLLAWFNKPQINAEVTISIVTLLVTAFGFYCAKDTALKKSRNEYGLDENGVPYNEGGVTDED